MAEKEVMLKDEKVSLVIRTYKTSKNIKAYYKGNVLYISKPRYVSLKEIDNFIKRYEDDLYNEYIKIKSNKTLFAFFRFSTISFFSTLIFVIVVFNTLINLSKLSLFKSTPLSFR